MRLASFKIKGGGEKEIRLGAVLGDQILDLNKASGGRLPSQMLAFIEGGEKFLDLAQKVIKNQNGKEAFVPLNNVQIKSPLPNPPALRDFFAFEEHAKAGSKRRNESLSQEWYEIPAYYKGNHREIYGPDDEIPWPSYTQKLDFECEIACVVGKKGKNLTTQEAKTYIFGYMIFNDFSARDTQKREMKLRMGPTKAKDFANAFGPYLVTANELDPAKDLSLKVKVNGEVWSQGHFKDQHWGFPLMVSYVSQSETIYPGDILGSGTFYKGCGLDLDRWIKPGDVVELEVPKLGTLRNTIGRPQSFRELNYRELEAIHGSDIKTR